MASTNKIIFGENHEAVFIGSFPTEEYTLWINGNMIAGFTS
jgi:hypothetical protein